MTKIKWLLCVLLLALTGCSRSLWAWPTEKRLDFPAQRIELVGKKGERRLMWFCPLCQNDKIVWALMGPVKPEPTTQPTRPARKDK